MSADARPDVPSEPSATAPAQEMARPARLPVIDVARGVALVAMFVYHFSWDLLAFGLIRVDVTADPGWRAFSRGIAASFLILVGVSLVLAARGGLRPGPYLRRLGAVSLGALIVTGSTYVATPQSFIYFGILHCIAVSSVLALPFLRAPAWWTALLAALVVAAPAVLRGPAFDGPAWLWLGLASRVPDTSDYEPILPWFGAVLAGVAVARWAVDGGLDQRLASAWPGPFSGPARLLAAMGRHSLPIYLIHQPLFYGALSLAVAVGLIAPGQRAAAPPSFVTACIASCEAQGAARAVCSRLCSCVGERIAGTPLSRVAPSAFTPAQSSELQAAAEACKVSLGI